jgi:hypothetical protein
LSEVVFPSVTEVQWQSTGDFLLSHTCAGETNYFHLDQTMLEIINKTNIQRNPWVFRENSGKG